MTALRVAELWRFPVKSLQGEQVDVTTIDDRGLTGDRHWSICDVTTGLTLTARRQPLLLLAHARLDGGGGGGGGGVEITLPDGSVTTDDAALSAWLGRPVELREAGETDHGVYETPVDFEREDDRPWIRWEGPRGTFHDSKRTRVSIVSRETIRDWDRRRFRANVLIHGGEPASEDELVGHRVEVGSVALDVVKQIDRCVVTTRPQPGGLTRDLDVLRTINRGRAGCLGVGALVAATGRVRVGDEVRVVQPG